MYRYPIFIGYLYFRQPEHRLRFLKNTGLKLNVTCDDRELDTLDCLYFATLVVSLKNRTDISLPPLPPAPQSIPVAYLVENESDLPTWKFGSYH